MVVEGLGKGRLDADDRRHLVSVLRLREGEAVSLVDGHGWRQACTFGPGGKLEPDGEPVWEPPGRPAVTVAFAVPKGDRAEWAVQKLTEIGVDRIVLIAAQRSVVRWSGDRAGRHLERLRAVARAATCQSRRAWLPAVEGPVTLAELAAQAVALPAASGGVAPSAASGGRASSATVGGGLPPAGGEAGIGPIGPLAVAEPGGAPPALTLPTLVVGPEGGWAPSELDLDLPKVGLGPTVLRTETAAVVGATLLTALRARLVSPTLQGQG